MRKRMNVEGKNLAAKRRTESFRATAYGLSMRTHRWNRTFDFEVTSITRNTRLSRFEPHGVVGCIMIFSLDSPEGACCRREAITPSTTRSAPLCPAARRGPPALDEAERPPRNLANNCPRSLRTARSDRHGRPSRALHEAVWSQEIRSRRRAKARNSCGG